jgi:hypothetical protein
VLPSRTVSLLRQIKNEVKPVPFAAMKLIISGPQTTRALHLHPETAPDNLDYSVDLRCRQRRTHATKAFTVLSAPQCSGKTDRELARQKHPIQKTLPWRIE